MTVGEIVADASRTLARTAHVTIPLVVAFELPLVALAFASDEPLDFAVTSLYSLVSMVAEAAVLVLADQSLRAAELQPRVALTTALTSYGRNFITGMVSGLQTFALLLLLVLPGIWRALTYVVAVPIAIHEQRSGVDACRASAERMQGHLGAALVALFLAWLPFVAVQVGVFVLDESLVASGELPAWYSAFVVAAYVVPIAAMLPVSAVQAVLYHRTRPRDHAEVAEIFA